MSGLGAEVTDLGHTELHARGEFITGDACGEFAVGGMGFEMAGVHLLQKRTRGLVGSARDA